MSESRETRLKKLRCSNAFVYASAAQCTNGEGMSLMILDRDRAQLTVGQSWLELSMERMIGREQSGWMFFTRRLVSWTGGPSAGAVIEDDERQAIMAVIVNALSVLNQSVSFSE